MPGLPDLNYDTATIAGVDCHTAAWTLTNSHVLRDPAPRRRRNVALAGVDGVLGRVAVDDQRVVDLEFYVVGEVDDAGVPAVDVDEQLEANIETLRDSIYYAATDSEGAVSCVVVSAAGVAHSGRIQLDDFVAEPGTGGRWVNMQATLIDGWLAPGGS
jgi:hypothetical protein